MSAATNKALAQNFANNQKNTNKSEINTANNMSATDFAVANVGKYYPDMVEYTKKLMNSFISKEQKDFVNKTLAELIKKYPNDKDKIRFIIGTLEGNVFVKNAKFSDTYRTDPTDLDFELEEAFGNIYKNRFNTNLENFEKTIKEMEENIKNMKENIKNMEEKTQQHLTDISNIMNSFSKEDIIKDKNLYELVKRTKNWTDKYQLPTTPHMKELYSIIK